MTDGIRFSVPGLKQLRNDLRKVDAALPRQMTAANKAFAAAVVPKVQAAYSRLFPRPGRVSRRRRGKNTVSQIRAVSTQTSAGIRIGASSHPFMVGQEFGSNHFRQFAPWTGPGPSGRGSEGRFLHPTLRAEAPNLRGRYLKDVVDKVLPLAFPERN